MKKFLLLTIFILSLLSCSKEDLACNGGYIAPSVWQGDGIQVEFSKVLIIKKNGVSSVYNYKFGKKNSIQATIPSTGIHLVFKYYRNDIYMKFGNEAFGYYNLVKLK